MSAERSRLVQGFGSAVLNWLLSSRLKAPLCVV